MPSVPHIERHFTATEIFCDIVIGMLDGLTVPFALAAGFFGAGAATNIVITGYGLTLLLEKMAFVLPGGIGVIESSMAALYGGLGVPSATRIVVIPDYRLPEFWFPNRVEFPVASFH